MGSKIHVHYRTIQIIKWTDVKYAKGTWNYVPHA